MTNRTDTAFPEFSPHDLLVLDREESFVSCNPSGAWVAKALEQTRTVVVRRGVSILDFIPVGVRGPSRAQRCAGIVPRQNVIEVVTPESLVERHLWRLAPRAQEICAIRHLEAVFVAWKSFGVLWGPTGSVGFELATGFPAAKPESDLDIRIIAPKEISIELAQELLVVAESADIRIDVQMETSKGAVALAEYASRSHKMLLRTNHGPLLVVDPWAELPVPEAKS